jgi:hypothetical protein
MKIPIPIIAITFFSLWIWGCKKDPKEGNNTNTSPSIEEQNQRISKVFPTVKTNIFLRVIVEDEEGKPLAGVQIHAGEQSATTDVNGTCLLEEISINKDYALVTATKPGYMKGSRTISPTPGAFNTAYLVMAKQTVPREFNGRAGSTIKWDNGGSIYFPPNALVDAQGQPYSGLVKMHAKYLHPNDDHFNLLMPGTLVGLTEKNTLTGMLSYGMIMVELNDAVGNPLQLGNGKTAKVTLPAVLDAPEVMPTWHFNEKYGLWVEVGRAKKVGTVYEFEANSFSAWNLDIFVDDGFDDIILEIMNENKKPIPNQVVQVFAGPEFNHKSRLVHTDEKGKFRMVHVPKDLRLRLMNKCEDIEKNITLTSATKQVEFDLSKLNRGKYYTLHGKIKNCLNEVYSNANFFLQSIASNPGVQFIGKTDQTGQYSTNAFFCDIDPNINHQMIAQVYTGNNKFRRDTIRLQLTDISQRLDVSFCAASELTDAYPPDVIHCNGIPTAIFEVINPTTGKVWMDRNLGALKVASYRDDSLAFGDLYQWGRKADGHQCRNSEAINTPSSTDHPEHSHFILGYDWRSPHNPNLWQGPNGENNPCPIGFRIPTEAELEEELSSWTSRDDNGAFNSPLKLTMGGRRNHGSGIIERIGSGGRYWSSTTINGEPRRLRLGPDGANVIPRNPARGHSVRCIKHDN